MGDTTEEMGADEDPFAALREDCYTEVTFHSRVLAIQA